MSKKPVIISFEGIDGSGKGLQSELLVKKLEKMKSKVLVADFPQYKDFFGKEIGKLLSGNYEVTAENLDAKSASLWYALDRFDFFKDKDLTKYDVVIMNRSTYSNIGFQTTRVKKEEQKEFIDWVKKVEFEKLGIPKPTKTIFLNIDEENSQKNVSKKGTRNYIGDKADVYEQSTDMLSNAQEVYRNLAKTENNFIQIDCLDTQNTMLPIENIEEKIWQVIEPLVGKEKFFC